MGASDDGGLRAVWRKYIPEWHWQPVESTITGSGIPDMNCCYKGVEFWVENKKTTGYAVSFQPMQPGWHLRRARAGGRTFVAVRRLAEAGPRKGPARDELHLYGGEAIKRIMDEGVRCPLEVLEPQQGGPENWDWDRIRKALLSRPYK